MLYTSIYISVQDTQNNDQWENGYICTRQLWNVKEILKFQLYNKEKHICINIHKCIHIYE